MVIRSLGATNCGENPDHPTQDSDERGRNRTRKLGKMLEKDLRLRRAHLEIGESIEDDTWAIAGSVSEQRESLLRIQ
jgi:hypothetical protein